MSVACQRYACLAWSLPLAVRKERLARRVCRCEGVFRSSHLPENRKRVSLLLSFSSRQPSSNAAPSNKVNTLRRISGFEGFRSRRTHHAFERVRPDSALITFLPLALGV